MLLTAGRISRFVDVNFCEDGRVQFYRVSGLAVASEIELPGLIAGVPGRAPRPEGANAFGAMVESWPDKHDASSRNWSFRRCRRGGSATAAATYEK